MNWETVIGLEVHAKVNIKSKLFSSASSLYGATPNSQVNYIDAALPGVLPVINQKAIEKAILFGLAINAEINNNSYFERKNYFYPDLPKGYQISQNKLPIVQNGYININNSKTIFIARAHLEEDAGKLDHEFFDDNTAIDLNRAGSALLEIVTTPCLNSVEEVDNYLKKLHQLLKFLDISDGNMQDGSFRCDVNISLRASGSDKLGVRTELKNLNSFRFIEKAIIYEQQRHASLLANNQKIFQETRGYSPEKNQTFLLRSKEEEADYRYFPDPDLMPINIGAFKIHLPKLPQEIEEDLQKNHNLSEEDCEFLLNSRLIYNYFEKVLKHTSAPASLIINWFKQIAEFTIEPSKLAVLLTKLHNKELSHHVAKKIFVKLNNTDKNIDDLIKEFELEKEFNIDDIISSIIKQNPKQVEQYLSGKEKILDYFVGQVLKITKGSLDPTYLRELFKKAFIK